MSKISPSIDTYIIIMTNVLPQKSTFLASSNVRLDVVDVEKKLMHHRRYIIKVTLDTSEFTIKKKFDAIKKFLDLIGKKVDLSQLQSQLRTHLNIRTKKQVQICQKIFNKINGILRDQSQNQQLLPILKDNIYSFLQMEELPSNDQDDKSSGKQGKQGKQANLQMKLNASGFSAGTSPSMNKKRTLPFSECWAKLETDNEWQFYRIWIKDQMLVLNLGVSDDYYYLKGCNVQVLTEPYYVLKVYHKFDKNPLEIRINSIPNLQSDDPDEQLYEIYVLGYSFLKQICQSKERIDSQVCGKFIMKLFCAEVSQKQKDKQKQNEVKQFFIKITHEKVNFCTGLYFLKKPLAINLYIPLINPFGNMKVEMLTKSQSWLHKQLVQVSLGETELLIQQVLGATYQLEPITYKLPFSVSSEDQSDVCVGFLKCGFESFNNISSHFVTNQLHNYEGQNIEPELDDARQEIRMSGNRIKRIIYNVDFFKLRIKQLSYFKYPIQSYIFYSFIILFFLVVESFFRTMLLLFICIAVATYTNTWQYIKEIMSLFADQQELCKLIKQLFETKNDKYLEPKVRFKKHTQRTEFLANFEIKMKKGGNIFTKYKRLQKNLFLIRFAILIVVGTVQKLKNLLNWTQPKKTLIFICICAILFIFVGNFPIRYIFLCGTLFLMIRNRGYYKKLYNYNRLVVYEIIRITANSQNGQFNDFKQYLRDPMKQFDLSKSYISHFQKKLAENLENLTDIEVPNNLIIEYNSINSIQNLLMTLPRRIRIDKKYKRELGLFDVHPSWFSDGSSSKRIMNSIYDFLYNIPSDRYLLEYEHNWKLKRIPN